MEVTDLQVFVLDDASGVGGARRRAVDMATRLGFGEEQIGRVALIVTEAGTNVVKHGRGGELIVYVTRGKGGEGIGVIAVDRGPGMENVGASMRDGTSTRGTPGTGLGAIRRLSTRFDVHSSPAGTAILAEVSADRAGSSASHGFELGALCVPYPGEERCGDAWAVIPSGRGLMVLAVDGLGHGFDAATAADEATRLFRLRPNGGPTDILSALNDGLRPTRGAAAAVADVDCVSRVVRFAGVGNISASIIADGTGHSLVSGYGTLGHVARGIREFTYPWPSGALLVLHSDGLSARWDLEAYPGLVTRHPMLIAGVLYRDFRRRTDDASIVVLREAA